MDFSDNFSSSHHESSVSNFFISPPFFSFFFLVPFSYICGFHSSFVFYTVSFQFQLSRAFFFCPGLQLSLTSCIPKSLLLFVFVFFFKFSRLFLKPKISFFSRIFFFYVQFFICFFFLLVIFIFFFTIFKHLF